MSAWGYVAVRLLLATPLHGLSSLGASGSTWLAYSLQLLSWCMHGKPWLRRRHAQALCAAYTFWRTWG